MITPAGNGCMPFDNAGDIAGELPDRPLSQHDHRLFWREGIFDAALPIGRQDDESLVILNALQKIGRLSIRVTAMGIVDMGAFPK